MTINFSQFPRNALALRQWVANSIVGKKFVNLHEMPIEIVVPDVPEPILVEVGTTASETTASILAKLDGAANLVGKIGAEYLPPEWFAATVTAAAPGEFQTATAPTAAWWDHVVECAYNVSLPFEADTYTGKKFILKTSAAIIIDGAVIGSFAANITIPAAANFEYRLTLIESIGGQWRATLNYSGVTAGGAAPTLGGGVANALAINIGTNGAVQLQGDPLTPTSIILPDVTSVVPAANSMGLKNGRITIGNGVTTGGVPVQARTMKGMLQFNTGSRPITGAFTRIAAIPIYPADFLTGGTNPNFTIYGEITLSNDSYSANIKDWGVGFAFNDDSLLAKSDATWIYGSLHPAPGTAKDLTWMTMKLRAKSQLYALGGNMYTIDTAPVYSRYGVDTSLPSNVTNYPKGSMPNNSASQRISSLTGGNLWLMVNAEKITGQPVGGVITVNYDLTFEFP